MKQNFPLVRQNLTRADLDKVIEHLKSEDPILTSGPMWLLLRKNGRLAGCQTLGFQFWFAAN